MVHFRVPRQPLGYNICSGIDPATVSNLEYKVYGIVELSSLILNLFIYARIKIYQNPKTLPFFLTFSQPVLKKCLFFKDIKSQSLPGVANGMVILVFLLSLTLTLAITNNIDVKMINDFPQTLMVSISQFV